MGKNAHNESFKKIWRKKKKKKKRGKSVAADGFDPSTSGLWAQHASTAPRCCGGRKGKLPNVDEKKEKKKKEAWLAFRGEEKSKRPIRDLNP